jgi:hypothetical protein
VRIIAKSLLAALISMALVQAPVMAAPAAPALGVVLQANNADVGATSAVIGSTVFAGDRLATNEGGALRVGLGTSQAYLVPHSSATVQQFSDGLGATLTSGTVVLNSVAGGSFRLSADGATIRPNTPGATSAQVTMVSPTELLLLARKGSLEVSMDDDVKTVPEGASYRMLILPPDAPPGAAAAAVPPGSPSVLSAGRNRFIFIVIVLIAIGLTIGIIEATLSPHKN